MNSRLTRNGREKSKSRDRQAEGCSRSLGTEDGAGGSGKEPGQHVTTIVGSNVGLVKGGFTAAKRREIDDATLAKSHVHGIVSIQQAVQDEQADIYDPVNRGVIKWEQLIEIGSILAGNREGRTRMDQITFYKNNAGQGVADVALGAKVLENIIAKKKGQTLNY